MGTKKPEPPPVIESSTSERPTSPPPPPIRLGCQQCERLREDLRFMRHDMARLQRELEAYRALDAAGRIDRSG